MYNTETDRRYSITTTEIATSSMCTTYRLFKTQLIFEKYLLIPNQRKRIQLTKFRCVNSKIPVYNRIYMYDSDM